MGDFKLVGKIVAGNERVVGELYEKYSQRLLNFILLKIDNPPDAEEILQDTFVSALDSLPLFSGKSLLFTWLCGIAKHEVADFYRKKKIKTILFSRFPVLEELASRALGPEEELMEAEIRKRIKIVFRKLSEGYRRILRLKYIEGCSVAEVARILGVSCKAAESKLTRARLAFREAWATENYQLPTFVPSSSREISNREAERSSLHGPEPSLALVQGFQTNSNDKNSKNQKENTAELSP